MLYWCPLGVLFGPHFLSKWPWPDPNKVYAVQAWPKPTDVTALRQFLGFASYYRRYVLKFADIAAPLHTLTQKGVLFQWTTAHDESFTHLKSVPTQAPVLIFPLLPHHLCYKRMHQL